MKKNIKLLITLILILTEGSAALAGKSLANLEVPEVLLEGTEMVFEVKHKQAIQQWMQNTKIKLDYLISDAKEIRDKNERVVFLRDQLGKIVDRSFEQRYSTELFMRYILNRGRVISDIIEREYKGEVLKRLNLQLRVLMRSITLAQEYYEVDQKIVEGISGTGRVTIREGVPFAKFATAYSGFLYGLNQATFDDASVQYLIGRSQLMWLAWDLAKDSRASSYRDVIELIIDRVQEGRLPDGQSQESDTTYMNSFRKLQKIYEQVEKLMSMLQELALKKVIEETRKISEKKREEEISSRGEDWYKLKCAQELGVYPSVDEMNACIRMTTSTQFSCLSELSVYPSVDQINACNEIIIPDQLSCVNKLGSYPSVNKVRACAYITTTTQLSCVNKLGSYPEASKVYACSGITTPTQLSCVSKLGSSPEADRVQACYNF